MVQRSGSSNAFSGPIIIYFRPMKATRIAFISALCLLSQVSQSQKIARVQCQLVTTNICNSGYSYKVTSGSEYSEYVCLGGGQVCDLSVNQQVQLTTCQVDYLSTQCTTGVCFKMANKEIAYLGGDCSRTYTQNITCGRCQATACPTDNCQTLDKSTSSQLISCVDKCPDTPEVDMTITGCTGGTDQLGVANGCCMTFNGVAGPVCTTQSRPLLSQKLASWVRGERGNYNDEESILVRTGIMALCLIAAIIFLN